MIGGPPRSTLVPYTALFRSGSWDTGPLRVTADVARTDSTFTGSTASVDYAFANRQTITFDTDVDREDGGAEFSFANFDRSEEHTSELQSRQYLVCRLLLEKK